MTKSEYSFTYIPTQPVGQPQLFCSNNSGWNLDSEQKSTASVTVVWEWIGEGPAPTKVWVLKTATATGRVTPDGTVTVDNGLGHPATVVNDATGAKKLVSSGTKWSELSLSGKFLRVDFDLSAKAVGHAYEGNYFNNSLATLSYGISFKAAPISTNRGLTVRSKGDTWDSEPAPRGESHVAFYSTATPNGYGTWQQGLNIIFSRSLIGAWVDPFHEWTDETDTWVDTLTERDHVWKTILISVPRCL